MSEQMTAEAMEQRFQRLEPWWTRQLCTEPLEATGVQIKVLRELCAACPVLEACRRDVLQREAGLGRRARAFFVAGMTPKERAAINGHLCRDCQRQPHMPKGPFCDDCSERHHAERRARWGEKEKWSDVA